MRIQNNIAALNTSKNLAKAQKSSQSNIAKLSSGYAINKAGDNASGLAVSEKMRSQIRGLKQASKNATDGINLVSTAEGYMSTANDILQRMRELAVQSANGTYDPGDDKQNVASSQNVDAVSDRAKINEEIQQLTDELDRIASTAKFNGRSLSGNGFAFQVGDKTKTAYTVNALETFDHEAINTLGNSIATKAGNTNSPATGNNGNYQTGFSTATDANNAATLASTQGTSKLNGFSAIVDNVSNAANGEMIQVYIGAFDSKSLGVAPRALADDAVASGKGADGVEAAAGVNDFSGIDLTTQAAANKSIDKIDKAIESISANRARLGAVQNRLEYTVDNIATSIENTTASESAIRDTDMVAEMMDFTKNNVLSQAATAMMAQANSQTQSVLQLLQ